MENGKKKHVSRSLLDTYTDDTKKDTKRKYQWNYIFPHGFYVFFLPQVIQKSLSCFYCFVAFILIH